MKLAIDIGNSSVKGAVLSDKNNLLGHCDMVSLIKTIPEERYLTFTDDEFYIRVDKSDLNHFDDIVAVGNKAANLPDPTSYDVTSTSYKSNHPITTSLLFGSLAPYLKEDTTLTVVVSIPVVEARTVGLERDYEQKLTGQHQITVFKKTGPKQYTINITTAKVLNEGQAAFYGLLDTNDKTFAQKMNWVYKHNGEDTNPLMAETNGVYDGIRDFVVVDIGEGTLDLAVFLENPDNLGAKFNPDFSRSIVRGYGNILEDAIANAKRDQRTINGRKSLQQLISSNSNRRATLKEEWLTYVNPIKEDYINLIAEELLKTFGTRDFFDAIIFAGGGFAALTGYDVTKDGITMRDSALFDVITKTLKDNHKSVDLIFGIPQEDAQGINKRGLIQYISMIPTKK